MAEVAAAAVAAAAWKEEFKQLVFNVNIVYDDINNFVVRARLPLSSDAELMRTRDVGTLELAALRRATGDTMSAFVALSKVVSLIDAAEILALHGCAEHPTAPLRSVADISADNDDPNVRFVLAKFHDARALAEEWLLALEKARLHLSAIDLLDRFPISRKTIVYCRVYADNELMSVERGLTETDINTLLLHVLMAALDIAPVAIPPARACIEEIHPEERRG